MYLISETTDNTVAVHVMGQSFYYSVLTEYIFPNRALCDFWFFFPPASAMCFSILETQRMETPSYS